MQRKQTNVRVDNAFIEKMRELSKQSRRTISDINREALDIYFTNHVPPIDMDAIHKKEKQND
jgi:mRNA-degrading endonuclease RelE of RelBE toxin-antitoxin system